jgi:phosphatidylglycerol:prolipoprotein diacylglycerol transferase
MRSTLFTIPLPQFLVDMGLPAGIPIFGYGAMILVAYLVCSYWAVRRGRQFGMKSEQVQDLVTTSLISGIIGARFMHWWLYPEGYETFFDFFKLYNGGLVLYGFLFTTPWVLIYKLRKMNASGHEFLMTFAPVLPLGIGIGRLGCFMNGCCYGGPGEQAWCVIYPAGTLPNDHFGIQPIHPSQLYAFAMGVILALLLRSLPTIMPKIHGYRMALSFCFLYGLARLTEEAFRADTPQHVLGMFTAGQGVSLLLISLALLLWWPAGKLKA